MLIIEQLRKNSAELLKKLKSGEIDIERAEVLNDCADSIIKTLRLQIEYH